MEICSALLLENLRGVRVKNRIAEHRSDGGEEVCHNLCYPKMLNPPGSAITIARSEL